MLRLPCRRVSPLNLSFAEMKKLLFCSTLLILFSACNNQDNQPSGQPENDLDAARTFIRDALDGKFDRARELMLPDSTNDQTMNVTERTYERMSEDNKAGYRNATIQIYNTREVNDSTRIVTYSNSYRNKKDSLKVVHVGGQWLIDLKFTFQEHNPNGH